MRELRRGGERALPRVGAWLTGPRRHARGRRRRRIPAFVLSGGRANHLRVSPGAPSSLRENARLALPARLPVARSSSHRGHDSPPARIVSPSTESGEDRCACPGRLQMVRDPHRAARPSDAVPPHDGSGERAWWKRRSGTATRAAPRAAPRTATRAAPRAAPRAATVVANRSGLRTAPPGSRSLLDRCNGNPRALRARRRLDLDPQRRGDPRGYRQERDGVGTRLADDGAWAGEARRGRHVARRRLPSGHRVRCAASLPTGAQGFPYTRTLPTTYCVEDAQSSYYNQIVDSARVKPPSLAQWSQMARADGLFDWGSSFSKMRPRSRRALGPRVFCLHVWRGPKRPTAGCHGDGPRPHPRNPPLARSRPRPDPRPIARTRLPRRARRVGSAPRVGPDRLLCIAEAGFPGQLDSPSSSLRVTRAVCA